MGYLQRKIKMDVCISLDGEILIVRSIASDTILTLKHSIYKLTKINPKNQFLVFNGVKLKN